VTRGLTLQTPPSAEPVTLAEAKLFCRIDIPDDDALVGGLVRAARQYVENAYNRQLVSAAWMATVDRFPRYSSSAVWQYQSDAIWQQRLPITQLSGQWYPDRASIRLTRPPLQAVTGITYIDSVTQLRTTVDPSVYNVDTTTEPGRVAPAFGQIWPIVQQSLASVQVSFVAGYGPVTSISAPTVAGVQTVTPASMFGIYAGSVLQVDRFSVPSVAETIAVTSVTSTTFTATFANAHGSGCAVEPAIPEQVRLAIKQLTNHWYENREAVQAGNFGSVPLAVEAELMSIYPAEYE
jgi:hypothetical protein